MELKKGDEYLAPDTGTVYRIYATSIHGTQVVIASAKKDGTYVVHMNPERVETILRFIRDRVWIPNTPAARTLYGYETK